MVTVNQLIESLKKFDGDLPVCVYVCEESDLAGTVMLETKDDHAYDGGDHICECVDDLDTFVTIFGSCKG